METVDTVGTNPRFNVQWSILYRGEDFVSEGTIVDLSLDGGRFAGTMPVAVGMHLALFIDSPQKNEDLMIEDATVMWVREHEFGARFTKMRTDDEQWLRGYFNERNPFATSTIMWRSEAKETEVMTESASGRL